MPPADYNLSLLTVGGLARSVYRRGAGPAVIVIHEVLGLHRQVVLSV